MILVDTSVWVDHFSNGNSMLESLLGDHRVLSHPSVVGELACGDLAKRRLILESLHDLPKANVASNQETLAFIECHELMGKGIAYIDAQLLAATALSAPARIWTVDRRLKLQAERLGLAA